MKFLKPLFVTALPAILLFSACQKDKEPRGTIVDYLNSKNASRITRSSSAIDVPYTNTYTDISFVMKTHADTQPFTVKVEYIVDRSTGKKYAENYNLQTPEDSLKFDIGTKFLETGIEALSHSPMIDIYPAADGNRVKIVHPTLSGQNEVRVFAPEKGATTTFRYLGDAVTSDPESVRKSSANIVEKAGKLIWHYGSN